MKEEKKEKECERLRSELREAREDISRLNRFKKSIEGFQKFLMFAGMAAFVISVLFGFGYMIGHDRGTDNTLEHLVDLNIIEIKEDMHKKSGMDWNGYQEFLDEECPKDVWVHDIRRTGSGHNICIRGKVMEVNENV